MTEMFVKQVKVIQSIQKSRCYKVNKHHQRTDRNDKNNICCTSSDMNGPQFIIWNITIHWSSSLLSPAKYLLQRVLTFASKQTPCLNTSSLCMGILKSCASSTKLYLVTPGIAQTIGELLPDSCFTTALETCRYAHPLRNRSPRTRTNRRYASLRRSSGMRRSGRDGLIGWWMR